jgi:hypothetical protein
VKPVLLVVACEAADVKELTALLWTHRPTGVLERETPDGPAVVAGFLDRGAALLASEDLDFRFTFELIDAPE